MRIFVISAFATLAACGNLSTNGSPEADNVGSDDAATEGNGSAQADILGTWTCSQTTKEGTATGEVTYASGGRTSTQMEMTIKVEGNTVELAATGSGTWEVEGDRLTEELNKFTILGATVNKAPVTDQSFINRFEESMEDQIITSTIKTLDDESLFVTSGDNNTTCSRG